MDDEKIRLTLSPSLNGNYAAREKYLIELVRITERKNPGTIWHLLNCLYERGEWEGFEEERELARKKLGLDKDPN